jgi:DNA-binding response OmpR family regulator
MGDRATQQLTKLKGTNLLNQAKGASPAMDERQLIMVVDDDQEMLRLLNRTLKMEGFDAIVVTDGNSALNLMEEINPDLIILDIVMPGLDGFQTLNLIREHSNVPVIMLTAKHEVDTLKKALLLGADDYVKKPISTRSLIARIQAKLRRSRHEVSQPLKKNSPTL